MKRVKGVNYLIGIIMKLKSQLFAAACSLMILNPLDASRPLQNPRTLHDTSQVLQDMSGQMKLMQEQLAGLKASQALLSAESAIKHLTPKVRKMEVHLERLEKQLKEGASSAELTSLKHEVIDLKQKLQAYVTAPDVSVETTLSALNPTLERMQKQLYYLHESFKKHQSTSAEALSNQVQNILSRFESFENAVQNKMVDVDSQASSLNLIRQALQASHQIQSGLKVEIEHLKAQSLPQIQKELESLKSATNADLWVRDLSEVKNQVQKLAAIFHKSFENVQETTSCAQEALQLSKATSQELKEVLTAQEKQLSGLKTLYKKEASLQEDLTTLRTLIDQKLAVSQDNEALEGLQRSLKQQSESLGESLEKVASLENFLQRQSQQIGYLYEKSKVAIEKDELEALKTSLIELTQDPRLSSVDQINHKLTEMETRYKDELAALSQDERLVSVDSLKEKLYQIDQLVQNGLTEQDRLALEASVSEVALSIQDLKKSLDPKMVESTLSSLKSFSEASHERLERQTKQIGFLYEKIKQTPKFDDLEELRKEMSALDSAHLQGQIKECASKIDHFQIEGLKVLEDRKQYIEDQFAQLASDAFIQIQELKKSLDNVTLESGNLFSGVHARLDAIAHHGHDLERLHKQSCYLYEKTKNLVSKSDMELLANALNEEHQRCTSLTHKLEEALSSFNDIKEKNQALEEKIHHFEASQAALSTQMASLSSQSPEAFSEKITNLQAELARKDEKIDKLAKKVAFLAKTLQDKQESQQSQAILDVKEALEEKMTKEIRAIQKDKVLFETLLQRIAALEANLASGDVSEAE